MPATTERARIVMARKIVSAVVAPTPTRKPARHNRVTVCEAMTAFTGPGGALAAVPLPPGGPRAVRRLHGRPRARRHGGLQRPFPGGALGPAHRGGSEDLLALGPRRRRDGPGRPRDPRERRRAAGGPAEGPRCGPRPAALPRCRARPSRPADGRRPPVPRGPPRPVGPDARP